MHIPDEFDKWIDAALAADPTPDFADEPEPERRLPLTESERRAGHEALATWQSPHDFAAMTKTLCGRCGSSDFFNQPKLKFLHDAHVLADFSLLQGAESVRLAPPAEQWPDGFAKIGHRQHNVEITSSHGDRQLGREYRELAQVKHDPIENWIDRANAIPQYLEQVIAAKSRKHYGSPCWLVVYLNMNEYGIRQEQTVAAITEIKTRYESFFEAISVLWKRCLY